MQKVVKKLYIALEIAAILAMAAGALSAYSRIIEEKIYEANAQQLSEMYSVVSDNFVELSASNFKHIATIQSVSELIDDENKYITLIEGAKKTWGYSHFYLLDRVGNYMTISQQKGRFSLDEHYRTSIETGVNLIRRCTLQGEGDLLLYISPVEADTYRDFDYNAMALGFDKATLMKTLTVDAYDGTGMTFVVGQDGRIVTSGNRAAETTNAQSIYSVVKDVRYIRSSQQEFRNAIQNGEDYNALVEIDGRQWYCVLVNMGYNDWNVLGLVPADVVNGSMTEVKTFTLLFAGGILAVIALILLLLIWWWGHRRIQEKDVQLKYREQLFDILSSQTDEVFLMFAPGNSSAEYISPNIEHVMGISYDAAMNDLSSIRPDCSAEERRRLMETASNVPIGIPEYREWSWQNPKTGESQWFSVTMLHVAIEDSEKIVIVFSDNTQDKENKLRLQEALDIAEAANKAKSSFLSNMSHDIRTPMNAIVGLCILLQKDAEDPERVRLHTKKITASSNHLLGLINDVLDMSKIESGKTTLNIDEFSLHGWVDELNTMIRPMAKAKQQKFEIIVKNISHETVMGDKLRLNQILLNILSNAIKYTSVNGHVDFTIEEVDQSSAHTAKFRFIVADNGMGMSPDYLKVLFDPFTREVNTKVNQIQGTGLGMAITKHLVDLMGGIIQVESEVGKGSTFIVEIGLRIVERDVDYRFWEKHGISRTLIVDDDVNTCSGIMMAMSGSGVDTQYATDGYTAINLTENAHQRGKDFDVILLDLRMPEIDGIETARRIRKTVPDNVPIFILTSYDFEDVEEEAKEAGITGFMPKPFFMANFMSIIEGLEHGAAAVKSVGEDVPPENALNGKRFLVAEDNELNSEILLELLEMEGASAVVCENGKVAVERFVGSEPGEFDAILMDVQMPIMNGYEATRTIRSGHHPMAKTIPIIAMTANAFDEDIENALDAGMNAHLAKPVDINRLRTVVSQLIKRTS